MPASSAARSASPRSAASPRAKAFRGTRRASVREIIKFWFTDHGREDWFGGGRKFDALVKARFGATHASAAKAELSAWRATPAGRLAEIIVLDQFSRQIHRGRPEAFACDAMALTLAQEAVRAGADRKLSPERRLFIYMPFMHSESPLVHREAMRLFASLGNQDALRFERAHRDVIARFGRYPKRNRALGRKSTRAERAYIESRGKAAF